MKLKSKLTLGAITILLFALSISCTICIYVCKNSILTNSRSVAYTEMEKLKDNLVHDWKNIERIADELTMQVAVKYCFFQQTKYTDAYTEYVLMKEDGETIYNNSGINPASILPLSNYTELQMKTVHFMGKDYIICGKCISFQSTEYLIYLIRDISSVYEQIEHLIVICLILSLFVLIIADVLLIVFLQKVLKPLEQMKNEAEAIAKGAYDTKLEVKGKDELSSLADSFNRMAVSVEQHILEVEEVAEARNRLIHALSHEMRTPITAISGYAYALRNMKMNEEQKADSLEFLEEETKRLERLSGKLTNLVGLSAKKIEFQNINLSDMKKQLAMIFQKQKNVILNIEDGSMLGERDLLLMLITNLCDNAKKAGATKIIVEITSEKICVTDNGKGMTEEEQAQIFEPFYQGDVSRNQKGFGLGLALCQKIAELHGTKIQVSSRLGQGSSFYLYNSFTNH